MANKAFLKLTEEEVKRALNSKMPADQPIFEEYHRYVIFFEKQLRRTGEAVACGALQNLAAEAAASNLLLEMDDLYEIPEEEIGQSRVVRLFPIIRTDPPSDEVKYYC